MCEPTGRFRLELAASKPLLETYNSCGYSSAARDALVARIKQLKCAMVSTMKIIDWIVRHGWALLLVGGLFAYIGFTQLIGKCPLCVVLDKIDAQTTNEAAAGK